MNQILENSMSVKKALFSELLQANPHLPAELAKVAVAADLTILVTHAGISRSELARKLGWSRARVSQVLSGTGNLTIETIHAIAQAAGVTFDVAFRKPDAARARQAWEHPDPLRLPSTATPEFPDGRKARAIDCIVTRHQASRKKTSSKRTPPKSKA